jgi:ABC-type sugar transport system substrate-binding protein
VGTAAQSWQPDSVRAQAIQFLATHPNLHIDCVYGHNDDNTMIMRDVISQTGRYSNVKYYGTDGLPRKDGGLAMVQQGKLEATVICPTRGFLVVEEVMRILDGKPYKRITDLSTSIVDRSNIDVVGTQTILMEDQMKRCRSRTTSLCVSMTNTRAFMCTWCSTQSSCCLSFSVSSSFTA